MSETVKEKKSRWLKPGIPVVHISNLEKVITVDHVVYSSKVFKDEKGNEVRKSRIDGVKCKWMDDKGVMNIQLYHTKELVPYEIALRGTLEAFSFINKEGKYKNY